MQKIIEVELGEETQEQANKLLQEGWEVLSVLLLQILETALELGLVVLL